MDKLNSSSNPKSISSVLAVSIFISALVGGLFGFLASEISTKSLRHALKQDSSGQEVEIVEDENGQPVVKKQPKLGVIEEESAVISAVEKASPAVVSIIVTKDIPKLDQFYLDPFFNDPFFNPFGLRPPTQPDPGDVETEKQEIGGGTGFIVSADGYIVTNRHVVEDEEAEYTVITNKGEKLPAQILAIDSFLDLAVIKVGAKDLPVIELGDSDKAKIGQTVIAIGNSLGEFSNTVSKGIISGLGRDLRAGDGYGRTELLEEVIQTDAAINPGNSGGPIVNLAGQAIGVNVAMAQGAENIGFAIPINEVAKIFQSVKETGKIVRPYLGVRYVINNPVIAKENNLDIDYGAIVVRGDRRTDLAVIPGSPADKAGVAENDIILEIDGEPIDQENDLASMIKKKQVGDEIELKVWSKGTEKTVTVVLEEAN